jgi:hypothetical protein
MFKAIRVWWMYWRYRNLTQRRQRLQVWMNRRGRPTMPRPDPYRGRATSSVPLYRPSSHRSLIPILAMVVCLTVLATYGYRTNWDVNLLHGLGALIILTGVYTAMRTV